MTGLVYACDSDFQHYSHPVAITRVGVPRLSFNFQVTEEKTTLQ